MGDQMQYNPKNRYVLSITKISQRMQRNCGQDSRLAWPAELQPSPEAARKTTK